jgi:two-component system chemotaxis response regulator CheB
LFTFVQGLGKTLSVPAVLTQHMPPAFTPMLAEHLTKLGGPPCAEARDGETIESGRLYLAPGDRHLLLTSAGTKLVARLSDSPPENYCRPSVDPMLRSAVAVCGGAVLMVMLTGMGHDGLNSTRELIAAGGAALAQDEATSVVWGMPGAIAQAGLCHKVLPLSQLASATSDLLKGGRA